MKNRILIISLLLLLCTTVSQASPKAALHINAYVLPMLRTEMVQLIDEYLVSPDDIRRGFVDLHAALLLRYQSNNNDLVDIRVDNAGAGEALILQLSGAQPSYRLTTGRTALPQELTLDLRIILPQQLGPGRYPLQINATTSING